MKYAQPTQFDEALALLAHDKWTILAGGTDYYPGLRDQAPTDNVLSIYCLNELRCIEEDGDFLRIGALVSWSDIVNPLSEFVLGNRKTALHDDELVSAILIPKQSMEGQSTFIKLGARKYLVISISMVAARMVCNDQNCITDIALSIGSCSLVAQRLPELEQALIGKQASPDIIDQVSKAHLDPLAPIDGYEHTANGKWQRASGRRASYRTIV